MVRKTTMLGLITRRSVIKLIVAIMVTRLAIKGKRARLKNFDLPPRLIR